MFTIRKFAEGLKAALLAIDPIVDAQVAFTEVYEGPIRYSDLLDSKGYEEAKKHPEVRRLLQYIGTEAGREIHGYDCWVDYLMPRLSGPTVITDVRFDNEAEAIVEAGGFIVRVTRDGLAKMDHASEAGIHPDWVSYTIHNGGTVYDLQKQLLDLVDKEYPE